MRTPYPLLAIALLAAACSPAAREAAPSPAPAADRAAQGESVVGLFHIIWNTLPRYFVADDAGVTRELLLDEQKTRALGGPLALNGKRVRVTGAADAARPELLRVDSIQLHP